MFSLIYAWINGWINDGDAGNFRRHRAHYDVIVMFYQFYLEYPYNIVIKSIN